MADLDWRVLHRQASESLIAAATGNDSGIIVQHLDQAIKIGEQAVEAAQTWRCAIMSQGLVATANMMRTAIRSENGR